MDYKIVEGKNERLISICNESGATHYLTGPAARNYMDNSAFLNMGIIVEWMDYSCYPEYEQSFGAFSHSVSVLDVIFNCGEKAAEFVWEKGVKNYG
jgi:hypothetical protein